MNECETLSIFFPVRHVALLPYLHTSAFCHIEKGDTFLPFFFFPFNGPGHREND